MRWRSRPGLATVATILDLVGTGAKVVAPQHAYHGSVGQIADLEARGRIKAELVDITDTAGVIKACEDAALVWLESPTNPALEVADIGAIVPAAHEAGAYVAVDNTFATPLLQQPLSMDADLVVHSATKFIAGHSDVLLGAAGHQGRPAVRRAQEETGPDRCDARHLRGLARPARAPHPSRATRAGAVQRQGARAAALRITRPSARSATPASAR